MRTFEHPATTEAAGYRACLRCRPYRVAGTVADEAPEIVCRAVRLIIDGVLDEARRLPLALASACRRDTCAGCSTTTWA